MLRTRYRVAALCVCIVALGGAQSFGQTGGIGQPNGSGNPGVILNYNSVTVLGSLAIGTGYVDLVNGALVVPTASFGFIPSAAEFNQGTGMIGSPGVSETGFIAAHDALLDGFAPSTGYWNGATGIESSFAANVGAVVGNDNSNGPALTAVGLINNAIYNYNSIGGVNIGPGSAIYAAVGYNDLIFATSYYGDSDLAGIPNGNDLANAINSTQGPGTNPPIDGSYGPDSNNNTYSGYNWDDGDPNYKGFVDGNDLSNIITNTTIVNVPILPGGGASFGPVAPALSAGVGAVPEPGSGLLLLVFAIPATAACLRRRLRARSLAV